MNPIKKTITLADGREITLETGKLAKQADGAVELRMGNTMLLATIVSAKEAGEGVDFMPLTVEYKEKFSSAGRFPGGFLKREGRAGDYEILTARLVDRVLRPLFPALEPQIPEHGRELLQEVSAQAHHAFPAEGELLPLEAGHGPADEAQPHAQGFSAAHGPVADNGVMMPVRGPGAPPAHDPFLLWGELLDFHSPLASIASKSALMPSSPPPE